VPDDGSDEPKYVTHCSVAQKCCVWRCTLYFKHSQHNTTNLNKKEASLCWQH